MATIYLSLETPSLDFEIIYNRSKILEKLESGFRNPDWYITLEVGNVKVIQTQWGHYFHILPLDLTFRRKISVHILHLYVPSTMLCIASMASLFIPHDFIPGRMGLSVTSCLSMITLFVGAK